MVKEKTLSRTSDWIDGLRGNDGLGLLSIISKLLLKHN